MNTSKKVLAMIISVPLMLGSATAVADGHKSGEMNKKGKGFPHGLKALLKDVELTDEQKSKLKQIAQQNREAYKKSKMDQKSQMDMKQKLHKELQALVLDAKFDEQKVRAIAEKLVNDQVDRSVDKLRRQHEALNVLTPEQKQKVQANMDNMAEKMKAQRSSKGNN